MKITCQACSAKYTIADDKVRGRKVKIRCKGCGTPIVVDGQKADAGDGLVGTPSMSDPPPAGGAPVESIPAPPPTPSGDVWNVNLSDTDSRTMTTDEIIAGWSSGLVTSDAFVWKDGMADWLPILDCAELATRFGTPGAAAPTGTPYGPPVVLNQQPAPAPAPAPAGFPQLDAKATTGAARLAGGRSNTADLFGGVDAAGSEQEVVMSPHASALPTAPGSTAYGDDKMTGARNENSVLFSLDSLKAGFAPAAPAPAGAPAKAPPKAPSARAAQTSNPDDPFGMGSSGGMMASPGGNALFSLSDNNALLTAPAPPEPPPVVAVSHDLSGGAAAPSPAQKRKQMILIGGIAAAVLVVGVVVGLALGGDKEEAKNDATGSAKAGSELIKDKPEEAKKEEPKPEEKPAEEAKKEEPKPEEKAADAAKTDPKKGATGGATKEKKEEKKEEPPPGPATDAPFSKASAISALSAAAAQAGGCKKPGGPTGAGKVQVTFAPSGRVTTANISGPPFAGTAVGGCIAGAFRRAKVPPFSGNPVTVQKSFSVN